MTLSLVYWLLMFMSLISSAWWAIGLPADGRTRMGPWGLILFLLFLVIGLKLFGQPIRG